RFRKSAFRSHRQLLWCATDASSRSLVAELNESKYRLAHYPPPDLPARTPSNHRQGTDTCALGSSVQAVPPRLASVDHRTRNATRAAWVERASRIDVDGLSTKTPNPH